VTHVTSTIVTISKIVFTVAGVLVFLVWFD